MPLFVRSEDHEILYHLLGSAEPGEFVSYPAMQEAAGKPVAGDSGVLQTVLRRLLKEDGIVFQNEPGKGYWRLTAAQTVDASDRDRGRLHNHARRNGRRLATADTEFATLDPSRRLRYATALSLFQAISAATTKSAMRMLAKQVQRTDMRPLPFSETLAAFLPSKTDKPQ